MSIFSLEAAELILTAALITVIVNYASLFLFLRKISGFFRCPLCLGFWVGAIWSVSFCDAPSGRVVGDYILYAVKSGLVTSIVAFMVYYALLGMSGADEDE